MTRAPAVPSAASKVPGASPCNWTTTDRAVEVLPGQPCHYFLKGLAGGLVPGVQADPSQFAQGFGAPRGDGRAGAQGMDEGILQPPLGAELEPGAHPVAGVGHEVPRRFPAYALGERPKAGRIFRLGAQQGEHQDLHAQSLQQDGLLVAPPIGRDGDRQSVESAWPRHSLPPYRRSAGPRPARPSGASAGPPVRLLAQLAQQGLHCPPPPVPAPTDRARKW